MNYQMALAAMLSVVTASIVSHLLYGHSFFDRQLLDRGIDVAQGRGHIEMMETPVLDIVSDDFVGIGEAEVQAQALEKLVSANHSEAYLLSDHGILLGKLNLQTLLSNEAKQDLFMIADQAPLSIKHDASLQQAIEVASDFVGESIPVVDRATGIMQGVVNEADLFKLYLKLQSRVTDLERS